MSKKGTKALASATLMSLVLTTALSAGPVKAAAGQVTRTSGADRYATAAQVATTNWTTSDNVVLVSGEGYADAVSATALAKQLNAPILLTTAGSLNADAAQALSTLQAKNVYVVGGDASISQAVRDQLKNDGYNLTELGGANRYATNAAVADELVKLGVDPSNVMMVGGEGFSDALSVAPIAAAKGQILLLGMNDANYMSPVLDFIQAHNSKVTIVGTKNVISDDILSQVNGTRVDGGQDRFDTNLKVLAAFSDTVKENSLYVASGAQIDAADDGYADALVASALAGKADAPLVLVDGEGTTATTNAINYIKANATTSTDLNVIGGTGVVSENTVAAINNAVNPSASTGTAAPGQAQVSSVTANSASSFQVKFAQAPADTSKISFSVTREGTPVTLTTTWDSTNTVATLTYSSNLPEDTYAVDVKDGDNDLGSTNVSVTAQKIAKIDITSTALGVTAPVSNGSGSSTDTGYATYKVLDQYGNDITSSALAQNITWTCGVGNVDNSQSGILKITPFAGTNNLLTQYTTATLNGIDQTTGVTASANLTVTQSQGTLSKITLNKLYCTNNPDAVLTAGDNTDSFYIDYTATDLSGNATNNYNLIKAGLMSGSNDTGNHITGLISSNPSALDVQLVTDPSNSNNALIQVTPGSSSSVVADQPVVITAFTSNGQSSSITLNLKKAATLDKLTLAAPSTTVSAGDNNVIIPFTAVDQNGAALTKYSDINGKVSITDTFPQVNGKDAVQLLQNPDGTAYLSLNVAPDAISNGLTSQSYTIQAVTNSTGSYSSINISVQKAATPNTLTVDNTAALPNMETGAVENLDFGWNFGGLAVKDQYGRAMDFQNQDTTENYYYVQATAISGTSVAVTSDKAYGGSSIQLKATGAPGSGTTTIEYKVMQHTASGDVAVANITPVDVQYTVLKTSDISGYTLANVNPVYDAAATSGSTVVGDSSKASYIGSANVTKFADNVQVYGTTTGGAKVALANSDILSASVDDTADFAVDYAAGANANFNTPGTATVGLYGLGTLNSTKTTASGTLSVAIKGGDGLIHTATAPISSKDDLPVAKSVGYTLNINPLLTEATTGSAIGSYTEAAGLNGVSTSGNNISVSAAQFANILGHSIAKYNSDGSSSSDSLVYLYAVDQYGTKTAPFTTFNATTTNGGYTLSVDPTTRVLSATATGAKDSQGNIIGSAAPQAGDVITLTGVTSNGLVESVNITITQ